MSRGQAYFPPAGTALEWGTKALDYSPWCCLPLDQHHIVKALNKNRWQKPSVCVSPLYMVLRVDQLGDHFVWTMKRRDWSDRWKELAGEAKTGLEACLAAEAAAEDSIQKLFPEWVVQALENNWRPPYGADGPIWP